MSKTPRKTKSSKPTRREPVKVAVHDETPGEVVVEINFRIPSLGKTVKARTLAEAIEKAKASA